MRSRFLASSSVNRRTFSIAITAWSANVCSSAICVRERAGSMAATAIAPMASAVVKHGDGHDAAEPSRPGMGRAVIGSLRSGISATAPVRMLRPAAAPRPGCVPEHRRTDAGASGERPVMGDQVEQCALHPEDMAALGRTALPRSRDGIEHRLDVRR